MRISHFVIGFSVLRLTLKIFGMYVLLYFGAGIYELLLYTILCATTELYELGALGLVKFIPRLSGVVYAFVGTVNVFVLFALLSFAGLFTSDFYLIAFIVLLMYGFLGGIMSGVVIGFMAMLFYFGFADTVTGGMMSAFRAPFLLITGIFAGAMGEFVRQLSISRESAYLGFYDRDKQVREKAAFMALVSANLGQATSAIRSYLSLLTGKDARLSLPERRGIYQHLERSTSRVYELLESVGEHFNSPSGKSLATEQINLASLVREVLSGFEHKAKVQHIILKFLPPGNPGATVFADRPLVTEALTHLLARALSESKPRTTLRVGLHSENDGVSIYVTTDYKEQQPDPYKGAFSHVHTIARRHGGKLWVTDSQESSERSYFFYLPHATIYSSESDLLN